ncbi:histidine kinase [Prauserella marina]|uniref:histidine kinase n=1 Tax=Prauserella marina TaxID=530584 RepID=A0A222VSJ2_9PSEU|nr:histidine kinase [Prauserella marina]ASR36860.1 histidine kinase [Prauserella marina]PWV80217.1 signal transduction histidine kinase [Prauserella marina]SDD49667.1 Signal transduction histidine kinase [Prauserella marina]
MTTEGISIPGVSVGRPGMETANKVRRRTISAGPLSALWKRPFVRKTAVDVAVIVIAVLDVWLIIPQQAETYSVVLSVVSCAALAFRRLLPFTTLLLTVPGFFAGWAQVAAMLALGYLATRKQLHWQVWVGAGLVWLCRFILWPLPEFYAMTWQEHALDVIYGVIVAGMPLAIGLLIGARTELSARLSELAASRDRERKLHAQAVRAEERARLAREMHDVVSHDITLIVMQAGAMAASGSDAQTQRTAQTIRTLGTHTLEELRSLVGVLRSSAAEEDPSRPDLADLPELIDNAEVPVQFAVERLPDNVPPQVSAAAYRTVQECLTNVRKHAPGATAFVRLSGDTEALTIQVRNDRPREQPGLLPSGGYGLTGLAERARLLGGTFETKATDDGGFEAAARYPVTT